MSEPWTLVSVENGKVVVETTINQAMLIARGLRHFSGASHEANWELSVEEVIACSNISVGIEQVLTSCSRCNGEGEIPINSSYPDSQTEDWERCPDCGGEGVMPRVVDR